MLVMCSADVRCLTFIHPPIYACLRFYAPILPTWLQLHIMTDEPASFRWFRRIFGSRKVFLGAENGWNLHILRATPSTFFVAGLWAECGRIMRNPNPASHPATQPPRRADPVPFVSRR
eukprot:COSAG01_NODE_11371_length_1949_cov_26.602703_3_plen_118_part_00